MLKLTAKVVRDEAGTEVGRRALRQYLTHGIENPGEVFGVLIDYLDKVDEYSRKLIAYNRELERKLGVRE